MRSRSPDKRAVAACHDVDSRRLTPKDSDSEPLYSCFAAAGRVPLSSLHGTGKIREKQSTIHNLLSINWIAYATAPTTGGPTQVYVVPYPAGEPVYPVTEDGGTRPAWSRDGRQLFYRTGLNERTIMMAVDVTITGGAPAFSNRRQLFNRPYAGTTSVRSYDVAEDGRFLMRENFEHAQMPVTEFNVVLNWFEELKDRVPTGGQ